MGCRQISQDRPMSSKHMIPSTKAFSFPLSLFLSVTFAVLCLQDLTPVYSSPIAAPEPLELLNGIRRTGNNKLAAEAGGVKKLKTAGPGVLKHGVLGVKTKVLQDVPVTKEVVKTDGVADKAVGTGSVLIDSAEDKTNPKNKPKKKNKGQTEEEAESEAESETPAATPASPKKNDDDDDDEPEDEGRGVAILSGLTKVADVGNNGGKDFKVLPSGD